MNTTRDSHDSSPDNNLCRDSSGRCSLRAAVEESNAHPGYDTITLGSATYVVSRARIRQLTQAPAQRVDLRLLRRIVDRFR